MQPFQCASLLLHAPPLQLYACVAILVNVITISYLNFLLFTLLNLNQPMNKVVVTLTRLDPYDNLVNQGKWNYYIITKNFFLWVNTRFGGCIYVCVFKLREIVSGLDPFG